MHARFLAHSLGFTDAIDDSEKASDARFTWKAALKKKTHYTKSSVGFKELIILKAVCGSACVGERERERRKEKEVNYMCGKAKAAPAMQSQKMTHDISNSICSI